MRDQDRDISKNYKNRARAAALVGSFASMFGGASVLEMATAQPAAAASSEATVSPNSLISSVDKKMTDLEKQLQASHRTQFISDKGKSTFNVAIREVFPDCDAYIISRPNHQNGKHFDTLSMLVSDKTKKPILTSIAFNVNSGKLTDKFAIQGNGTGYTLMQMDASRNFTPDTFTISSSLSPEQPWSSHTVTNSASSVDTVSVSTVNGFFSTAEDIIQQK